MSEEQKREVLSFSDDFNLSEAECLRLWIEMSQVDRRRWLETRLELSQGVFDYHIRVAVEELYYYEQTCLLRTIMYLMKTRYDENLSSQKKDIIMAITNEWLKGDIISHIISSIDTGFQEYQALQQSCHTPQPPVPAAPAVPQFSGLGAAAAPPAAPATPRGVRRRQKRRMVFIEQTIHTLSECLFYISYQTQFEEEEYKLLLQWMKSLSATLSSLPKIPSPPTAGQCLLELQTTFHNVLIITQLVHVCVVNVATIFTSRHVDQYPYTSAVNDGDQRVAGTNTLPITANAADEGDLWDNKGVLGVVHLAHACQRQSGVENHVISAGDVQRLFVKASNCRAYSYLRLCILPAVQQVCTSSLVFFSRVSISLHQLHEHMLCCSPMQLVLLCVVSNNVLLGIYIILTLRGCCLDRCPSLLLHKLPHIHTLKKPQMNNRMKLLNTSYLCPAILVVPITSPKMN